MSASLPRGEDQGIGGAPDRRSVPGAVSRHEVPKPAPPAQQRSRSAHLAPCRTSAAADGCHEPKLHMANTDMLSIRLALVHPPGSANHIGYVVDNKSRYTGAAVGSR
jgi:hypothetical protein